MKRFWKVAAVTESGSAFGIALDGRPVRTPAQAPLVLPTAGLAAAVADEWNGAGEKVDPRRMPLTGLSNAAIDRVAPEQERFADSLARYAASDLLCYRADTPEALVTRQTERWDPLLQWARRRYDVDFVVTQGVSPVDQKADTIAQLAQAVHAFEPFTLAGLSPLVTVGGSLIVALSVVEGATDVSRAWEAVSLDEQWQLDQWGHDDEAEKALVAREKDFRAGARFLELLA